MMETREYLEQYIYAKQEIAALRHEADELRKEAQSISISFGESGGNGQPNADKIPRAVEKITEVESRIEARANDLADLREEIYETIQCVQDCKLRTVLTMRYISGMSWEKIAVEMHYSHKHVTKNLHSQALEEVRKILKQYPKFP